MGTIVGLLIVIAAIVLIKIFIWPLLEDLWDGALNVLSVILPYIIGGVVLVGVIILSWISSDSFWEFIGHMFNYLLMIGACVMIHWLLTSQQAEGLRGIIAGGGIIGYLIYSIIKNIIVSDGFADFIINEIVSIAVPVILFMLVKDFLPQPEGSSSSSSSSGTEESQGYYKSVENLGSLETASAGDHFAGRTCASCKYYNESLHCCSRGMAISGGESRYTQVCSDFEYKWS